MRIFQVLPKSAHKSVPSNQTWYRNLYLPLLSMGHDVLLFPVELTSRARKRKESDRIAKFSQQLLDFFTTRQREKPFDLFFSYLRDDQVEPLVIAEISKSGVPTCNFSCNNTHQFHLVQKISPVFDYCLHAERDAAERFSAIGANPIWWPMASNPDYFKPVDVPRSIEASFVGGNYGLRANYAYHLLEKGIDLHLYGPLWPQLSKTRIRELLKRYLIAFNAFVPGSIDRQAAASALLSDYDFRRKIIKQYSGNLHPPVSDEKLIALYSESHISLGFVEVHDGNDPSNIEKTHLHLREFEAPMSGAFYCTGYLEELEAFYELDKEIVVYRSKHELIDKVKYYLQYPAQAEKIRQAGRQRALRDHTYQKRYQTLFDELGIGKN